MADLHPKIVGVLERAMNMAESHGSAFIQLRFDPFHEMFLFNIIPPEYISVSYETDNG